MTIRLYLAPAAAGKTSYLLRQVQPQAQTLSAAWRVLVPSGLQARAWRARLAAAGGGLGVTIQIFDTFYADLLNRAGQGYVQLTEPVQYRLLQGLVQTLDLPHYQPLRDRPGFIDLLQKLIAELKAAHISPDTFGQAVNRLGGEARLAELSHIYRAYETRLAEQAWVDRAGLGQLALALLERDNARPDLRHTHLLVDGFDNLTETQLRVLATLAGQTASLTITLTGPTGGPERPLVYHRFAKTRQRLERMLGVPAEPLPDQATRQAPALAHLHQHLFEPLSPASPTAAGLTLLEAPDREAEVRAALRWLKQQLVEQQLQPGEVALLARSLDPYRAFISQIGAEFGLPLRFTTGEPLRQNPAIAALLNLLAGLLPRPGAPAELSLPYRSLLEAWRTPYFDGTDLGLEPGDADRLDQVARRYQVLGGEQQWREALQTEAARQEKLEPPPTSGQALLEKFERFVARLRPPAQASYEHYVAWLEDLIGADPDWTGEFPPPAESGLNLVDRVRVEPATAGRDLAALHSFKELLRSLVWAEQSLAFNAPVTYSTFLADLAGAVEAAFSQPPSPAGGPELLVAQVTEVRGLSFRAVAIIGLAEGEFPARLSENPLLRDEDRRRLNQQGFTFDLSSESNEIEFFYEAISRPREALLLTRPRLADNGAIWPASPFWEEVRRLVPLTPQVVSGEAALSLAEVASWPELLESLAGHPVDTPAWRWAAQEAPARLAGLAGAAQVLGERRQRLPTSPFDGYLAGQAAWADWFGPAHTWSASRLESYLTCPFMFLINAVLKLEPRQAPAEGLDARQLGNLYHRLFELLYQRVADPGDTAQLLALLPAVAAEVLAEAPHTEGFRATAWWSQTRQEIEAHVRESLLALAEIGPEFKPVAFEQRFFQEKALEITVGGDSFRLHGLIDRVDRNAAGQIRLIDYKTAGPSAYSKKALQSGQKLQLALYALAARQALGLGEPVEGFYWHIQQAEASRGTLAGFESDSGEQGPQAAINTAVAVAWQAVQGARQGHFSPRPPEGGCPSYCSAAAFCHHYTPGFGG